MKIKPLQPADDPTLDGRLDAFRVSPAHDRVCQCIAAIILCTQCAMEYQQEIDVLLERYMLHLDTIQHAAARSDKAFDGYVEAVGRLLTGDAVQRINHDGDDLRRYMDMLISRDI